jgi:hypothetical protein
MSGSRFCFYYSNCLLRFSDTYINIHSYDICSSRHLDSQPPYSFLTLIRAAGGVYDFRNFEELYLCNGSSRDLQNSCIPRKPSREYILLSTLERKTAFSAIYRPKRARNRPFFRRFSLFRTAVKVYMTSPPPPQGPGTPPANSQRAKQFWSRPHGL